MTPDKRKNATCHWQPLSVMVTWVRSFTLEATYITTLKSVGTIQEYKNLNEKENSKDSETRKLTRY